jgi:energy-coupling factor transporter ATP-binding protein EcfA2
MATPLITVENFSYAYKGSSKRVLDNLSFSIEEFECCGLVGPSEAGKTTLCYAIASILNHYFAGGKVEGRISTCGLDSLSTSLEAMTKHVGILMQNASVYLTGIKPRVYEEIAFSMENFGMKRSTIVQRVDSLMGEMGIAQLADRDPLTLSGGEMQRVALASVLALDPPILILDEPSSSLDREGVCDLSLILRNLKGKKTILLVEQRMEMLPGLVDKLLVLRNGKNVYRGKAENFFGSPDCFEQEVGGPIWTRVFHEVSSRSGKPAGSLPYTYRQTLRQLDRAR